MDCPTPKRGKGLRKRERPACSRHYAQCVGKGSIFFMMLRVENRDRRPESEAILNREQVAEFTRRLQCCPTMAWSAFYETAYTDCRYDGKKLPPAVALQQLVACWRVMRKFRATDR